MRDQQSGSDSTAEMQRTTIDQSQEAMEQLIDLQRNMARMTLSAMKWQETAQKQGMEMTRSMMGSFPGQEFTQSMLENYLQGMQAVMPEMERAIEKGRQAAQPDQSMGGMGQQMRSAPQQMSQMERGQQMGSGSRQMGSQDHSSGERMERMESQDRGRTGREYGATQQYPQTGEWVTQGTYGGESTGQRHQQREEGGGIEQPRARGESRQGEERTQDRSMTRQSQGDSRMAGQERTGSPRHSQEEMERSQHDQQGSRQQDRGRQEQHGQAFGETTGSRGQRSEEQGRRGREERSHEQSSQRIEPTDRRRESGRQRRSIRQGQGAHTESDQGESEREGGEMAQSDMELSSERSEDDIDTESPPDRDQGQE
ncbi:hypothetical protein [Natronobacterium texcoconense]|uniref:Uncharacterized protein n=1 Tax=Natronobacterium texcoconense TaxID=1095778 RepID=A0A1H1EMU9_NATTX|nr:hypothetical protein [Natronobacterium texcoconense]SDQ90052.1 hypothetical protein SAMN04489842_1636 [Natronobacterium texcoconense]